MDVGDPAARLDLLPGRLELLGGAGDQQHDAAGVGDLQRRRAPDARGGAGDHHDLAAHRRLQRGRAQQAPAERAGTRRGSAARAPGRRR